MKTHCNLSNIPMAVVGSCRGEMSDGRFENRASMKRPTSPSPPPGTTTADPGRLSLPRTSPWSLPAIRAQVALHTIR
ncbi:hypothetical protein BV22DRAFT_688400 [Leucogyrophana mollusca]|uniref:Uncharacterized protein n=1 Tax=Leucogyrophana mollusca TaxID=85980 RepID=A0ACB8BB45_9AGAM|nr:hypothetical protein BV22DRAFT_688400 [Leucogyrophana mollusca]